MRDLAELLGVTALESDGLVARQADPADRRTFQLTLTGAGLQAIDRITELRREVSDETFAGLLRAFLDLPQ